MVIIAQKNAADAGVADEVSFEKMDFKRATSPHPTSPEGEGLI